MAEISSRKPHPLFTSTSSKTMSLTKATEPIELTEREEAWTRLVLQKARGLRFGSIQIKIHEAQVVLIEATEQTRFELTPKSRP